MFLRLMIILMLSGSPVSGLCSTCLKGLCFDNGECTIGCQRGYVGKYCDIKCPIGCVDNECYIGKETVTCISGCKAGYCGAKCSLRCPEGCLTCDRQCASCNMTLCPIRRFGVGCSEICSPRYEKCDRESGQCIRCRRGYYGDECDMECLTCLTREDDISDKCLSGCEKCQTEDTCTPGFYGEKCDQRCSSGCQQFDGAPEGKCNRATGECSAGCVSGHYGLTCTCTCSEHCQSGRCNRGTGECSDGCVSGYHGQTCNYTCNKFCLGKVCNRHTGACKFGCISGYIQKTKSCEELQNTGVKDLHISNTVLLILIICVAVSSLISSLVVLFYARRPIRRSKNSIKTENGGSDIRRCVSSLTVGPFDDLPAILLCRINMQYS